MTQKIFVGDDIMGVYKKINPASHEGKQYWGCMFQAGRGKSGVRQISPRIGVIQGGKFNAIKSNLSVDALLLSYADSEMECIEMFNAYICEYQAKCYWNKVKLEGNLKIDATTRRNRIAEINDHIQAAEYEKYK